MDRRREATATHDTHAYFTSILAILPGALTFLFRSFSAAALNAFCAFFSAGVRSFFAGSSPLTRRHTSTGQHGKPNHRRRKKKHGRRSQEYTRSRNQDRRCTAVCSSSHQPRQTDTAALSSHRITQTYSNSHQQGRGTANKIQPAGIGDAAHLLCPPSHSPKQPQSTIQARKQHRHAETHRL